MILECEMLIQNIAAYTPKEIVRSRRYPIAKVEHIVKYKHDGSAHNGIDDTYHHKLHKGLVSKQTYLTF